MHGGIHMGSYGLTSPFISVVRWAPVPVPGPACGGAITCPPGAAGPALAPRCVIGVVSICTMYSCCIS